MTIFVKIQKLWGIFENKVLSNSNSQLYIPASFPKISFSKSLDSQLFKNNPFENYYVYSTNLFIVPICVVLLLIP